MHHRVHAPDSARLIIYCVVTPEPAFVEAGLGHSVIGGYERGAFVVVLVIGCVFEAAWQITRGTTAMT